MSNIAISNILKVCMNLKKNESFIVVYDENKIRIANALLEKAKKLCKKADKIEIPVGKYNGQEPPNTVAKKIKGYDVAVLITTKSLSHTNARREASKKGVRIASMPGVTEAVLKRTMSADYIKIKKINAKIYRVLKKKSLLKVVTDKGTDVTMYANLSFNECGIYSEKGDFGNLPAGEVGFAPIEGKTNGTIVVDKTMAGIGKLKNDIRFEVKDGFAKKINGKSESSKLRKLLIDSKNKNAYNIAEFSFGTNYKARITGIALEDEKVYGTIHIALGDNTSYSGGTIKAPTHLDGVISKPTVFIDNKKIMNKGRLLL